MTACPYRWVPGHAVDPEIMRPMPCVRHRFHWGNHSVVGREIGRWWVWQHPTVRLRNLYWASHRFLSRLRRNDFGGAR